MRRLHLAELRDSWSAWLGVCVAFIVTNFALAIASLVLLAGQNAVRTGVIDLLNSTAFTFLPGLNIVFCAVIGSAVIGASTSLVVDSRRGSLARLALAGATPAQVVSTILSQLAVVSLACSLVGALLAYACLEPLLFFLANERGENLPVPTPLYEVWPVLLSSLLAVGVAVLGGFKQARLASRIPPVEALRQASGTGVERMARGRWVSAAGYALVLVAAYGSIPAVTAVRTKETFSNVVILSTVVLVVAAGLLARLAPVLVGPLTRFWTKAVPSFDPSWDLVRSTTVAKGARLTKSVVPVMMAIGLLFGMVAVGDALVATMRASGDYTELSGVGLSSTLVLLGLPLLIALAGGVGSLIMMSKQRDAELALSGIVGTTPGQRLAMPVLEGVIITVTGAILGVVMAGLCLGFLAVAIPRVGYAFAFSPSYLTFVVALAVCAVITIAATLLPTLPSLRKPEPRVIARLVAE